MMSLTAPATLRWMALLASLSVMQGTLELLAWRRHLADDGTWRWRTLSRELRWLSPLLAYRPFLMVLAVRVGCALLLLAGVHGATLPLLWITSLLANIRFRGSTNGGSDMMLMVVLSALTVAHLGASSPIVVQGALVYVAAQSVMSYFIAGVVKLIDAPWRRGVALASFVATPHFGTPIALRQLLSRPAVAFAASWAVILFECAFPLALTGARAAALFVALAACFHLGNVAAFGLNRFLLAWAASWPAVLHTATLLR
ncbi:MAG: hypothetical protein IT359_14515 [Gemmatimonadaceae bacterium]|nr:hypothetical protein [Gemmatimonadaceae bacterium]